MDTVPILMKPSTVRLRKGLAISMVRSILGEVMEPENTLLGISLSHSICLLIPTYPQRREEVTRKLKRASRASKRSKSTETHIDNIEIRCKMTIIPFIFWNCHVKCGGDGVGVALRAKPVSRIPSSKFSLLIRNYNNIDHNYFFLNLSKKCSFTVF